MTFGEKALARSIAIYLCRRRVWRAEAASKATDAGMVGKAVALEAAAKEVSLIVQELEHALLVRPDDLRNCLGGYDFHNPPRLEV
jgi:hypothetical protein